MGIPFNRADEYKFDHYTDAVETVKDLKRQRNHAGAENLLLWCIDFAEAENEAQGYTGLPRWYYKHLAIIYRKDD